MDNITHSLVGIALADLAVRRPATTSERRLFTGAGLIAANLPDIDILYVGITPEPLGYLLHHRGHSHTIAGLVVLAGALFAVYGAVPRKGSQARDRLRLWTLIAVALVSHVSLDALNSYGVHPFWPFDARWYYGDAVFIFEPALWVVLGIAAALNSLSHIPRLLAVVPVVVLPVALLWFGLIPVDGAGALALTGVLFALTARRLAPRTRAGAAGVIALLIIGALVGISRTARQAAVTVLQPQLRGTLVDVVMTPNPSSPLCWSVIGIEARKAQDQYVLWQGTLSLAAAWRSPTACASFRFDGQRQVQLIGGGSLALHRSHVQSLSGLRERARSDCWVRAWLQFGRAPVMTADEIYDLRFGGRGRNFTPMPLDRQVDPSDCPRNMTWWEMPRGDLLSR